MCQWDLFIHSDLQRSNKQRKELNVVCKQVMIPGALYKRMRKDGGREEGEKHPETKEYTEIIQFSLKSSMAF